MRKGLLYFDEFVTLNEAKNQNNEQKIKVIALTNLSEESYTIPAIEKECKKRKIEFRAIDINSCVISEDKTMKSDLLISDKNNKKPIKKQTIKTIK